MKPIIIRNSKLPNKLSWLIDIVAITLWPFIICRDEGNPTMIRHESIHIAQQTELLVLPFYLLYLFDFIVGLVIWRSAKLAYWNIRFEREAYDYQSDENYLINRKPYTWLKYDLI